MADIVSKVVFDIACLLDQHMGENTTVLDIQEQSSWTDYFVVSTVTSFTHMKGILRFVQQYLSDNHVQTFNKSKNFKETTWVLIDCGDFVIHLMTKEAREFYDLEKLWFTGKVLDYSSKSS